MARDFVINGETLVRVKFGGHMSGFGPPPSYTLTDLGLASEKVVIRPNFKHQDIIIDDFGPDIPTDIMINLADVTIDMDLIHYDRNVLQACVSESMGGTGGGFFFNDGITAPAGSFLGNNIPLGFSGNHFISLNLLSPVLNYPWRFPASFISPVFRPMEIPLGTEKTVAHVTWRAIPFASGVSTFRGLSGNQLTVNYAGEIQSSGALLWTHIADS